MGVALAAVADHGHLLALDEAEIAVRVVVDRCHGPNCGRFRSATKPDSLGFAPEMPTKIRSQEVTEGPAKAGARAMLRAVGLTEEDFTKPQVGVVSAGNEVTPCNLTGPELSRHAKTGVTANGGVGMVFSTIAVSDGISMGHEGMRASLVSREVIADSVELVMHAERFDALVAIAGCDKSLPGMMMAAARLDLPAVFLYGGSSLPGHFNGRDISIVDVFEGIGVGVGGQDHP